MATAITYPADPVTQGATVIQASVFDIVSADYTLITWASAMNIAKSKTSALDGMPSGNENPTWMFLTRSDLSGATATLRNLLGIQTTVRSKSHNVYSSAKGAMITVPVQKYTVWAHNWHPATLTLTDLTSIPEWVVASARMQILVDPETGQLIYATETHRGLYEAIGLLLNQNAATVPTLEPLINAISGVRPV